jgi:predicted tellurium resistance membrane protein TerC
MPLGVLVILQVIFLIALMPPQVLSLVSLVMAQLVGIAIAIILFLLMVSEGLSLISLVAFLATLFSLLMVTKIIVIVSTFTTEVAAAVKPSLRQSDRAAGNSRENDESYCESGYADQFGKS